MGIGYGGKSLKELTVEDDRLYSETGFYYGLKELKLRAEDPNKFERFYYRLLSTVIGARESVRYIASSPGTKEVGELVFALFTPEGDPIVFSTGIMAHVATLATFIKWLIRNGYEEDPGVIERRYFETNEVWAGNIHVLDWLQVTPIFLDGQVVGWAGGVIHALDAGGFQPGDPQAPTRFTEGVHVLGEVCADKDVLKRDYVLKLQHNTRFPELSIMDAKVRLAGNYMIREEIKKIVQEFGLEYSMRAIRELIEECRRVFLDKVKAMLIPGRSETVIFMPVNFSQVEGMRLLHPLAQRDTLLHLPIEVTIHEDGKLTFNFEGASTQGPHPYHLKPWGLAGGLWVSLIQNLAYDLRISHGMSLCTEIKTTPGSILDSTNPHTSFVHAWYLNTPIWCSVARLVSNMQFSRGFLEECLIMSSNGLIGTGAVDPSGAVMGGMNLELSSPGSGARAVADGLDGSFCLWNNESEAGNAESWEPLWPFYYVSRGFIRDCYAPGRFRGGVLWNSIWIAGEAPLLYVVIKPGWTPGVINVDKGLFGGYPAPTSVSIILRDTNVKELIDNKVPLPRDVHELYAAVKEGKLKAKDMTIYKRHDQTPPLKPWDVVLMVYPSGAGYGDPIERDSALAIKDIEMGLASPEGVKKTFGIVVRSVEGKYGVDLSATEEACRAIRKGRLQRAMPVSNFIEEQRNRILARKLPEHVIECYRDAMRLSEKFKRRFYECWKLPEDFVL